MHSPDTKAFLVAAQEYFAGERQELVLLLLFSLGVLLVCAVAFLRGDLFARGLAAGLTLVAAIGFSASAPLLMRDRQHLHALTARPDIESIAAETVRMDKVIRNYPYYRYGYALVLVCALLMIFWRPSQFVSGLACGLLILVVTGLIVDHNSESRARAFSQVLQDLTKV